MSEIKINRCLCGRQPCLVTHREVFGHGEYGISAQIQCTCGISGRPVEDYCDKEESVKNKAIDSWNRIISKITYREGKSNDTI